MTYKKRYILKDWVKYTLLIIVLYIFTTMALILYSNRISDIEKVGNDPTIPCSVNIIK